MLKFLFFLMLLITMYNKRNIQKITPLNINLKQINLQRSQKIFIQESFEWYLSIPKINLKEIPIKDGVSQDILENYIGHFPITSFLEGNICLAAHNNGYINNYFRDLNKLEVGDKIYYHYFNIEKIYVIKSFKVLKESLLQILDESNEKKLTLITCIDNSPQQRLCIEAICEE